MPEFLALMQEIGHERMRDGAYAWNIFHDPTSRAGSSRLLSPIRSELKYRASRETRADELIEQHLGRFLKEPQKASYYVAPNRQHHRRRPRPGGRVA